jgi:hypothetical protein
MSLRPGYLSALAFIGIAVFAGTASAVVIPDATGEEFSNNAHLDIRSVEVTNDASNISFKINLVGDPVATNWGKYMIGISTSPGGATSGNGWNRPISMSTGMDRWVGSWVDFGTGVEIYRYNGTWERERTSSDMPNPLPLPVVTHDSVTLTLPLSALGLSAGGQQFEFDVYTSGGGGGDSANDASSNPNQSVSNWPVPYDSGTNISTYTTVVPEPAALGLISFAGVGLLSRRR